MLEFKGLVVVCRRRRGHDVGARIRFPASMLAQEVLMASYILIRHKVKSFADWKRGYDAHLPKRIEAGLTEKQLLRGADDPNEVVLLFEARDLSRAKAFAESQDLRDTMVKVGVVDRPDIYFLNG